MTRHLDRIGQQIADYRLLRWLGGGGSGDVYLAERLPDHAYIALKLLHTQLSSSEELKAFINEARIIRLQHAHILPLLDFGISQEDLPYLVLEYVAQGTLRDRHPKGSRVPLPLIITYAQQIGSALQYAHEQRIVHRDVKPQNMLLRDDGTVLLSDFGLVAVIHSSNSESPHQEALGTIAYMAPEQIQGQAQAQSDQYSLGIVVYEWVTGQRPFQGTTVEIAMQHAMKPPPSLVVQVSGLSRKVEAVVLKALAKDPKERFASVSAFTFALEEAIQDVSATPDLHDVSPIRDHEQTLSVNLENRPVPSSPPSSSSGPRVDWDEAPTTLFFYGREQEQAQLFQWVMQEHCRVVSVLGMGGIGKSSLGVNVMHRLAAGTGQEQGSVPTATLQEPAATCPFEIIIFRSLRDAPSCDALLDECLQVFSPQSLGQAQERHLSASHERGLGSARDTIPTEQRLSLLLEYLRTSRVLLVLDNLECLLQEGNVRGHFRPGFEEYGQLLRRVAETAHQSCLLFTSREKPAELRLLEGKSSSVRSLRLGGLGRAACKQLLEEKGVVGTEEEQARLIAAYGGNPLALKVVAETIVDLFRGEIDSFLARGTVIFSSITDLLDEQFARLSPLEKSVLYWLAIVRESVTFDELQALFVIPLPRIRLFEAVDASYRHSLIESGKRPGSFLLQSVVLEYVTEVLIAEASNEVQQHRLDKLIQYGLSQAHAKEYVRQTQERLLISQLLAELKSAYRSRDKLEVQLLSLLDGLRALEDSAQGYGPANLIALLRLQRGHLRSLDLSHLSIRGVYFQGIEMQDASLAKTILRDTVFTEAFDAIRSVAVSSDGQYRAVGTFRGEVRVWRVDNQSLHLVWQAHTDIVWALAFSPDGRTLASGSVDGSVKLWDLSQGTLLWMGWHTDIVLCLAISPDGRMLASGGADAMVRLWDMTSGTNLQTLSEQGNVLWALAWSPDGSLLASGGLDGNIRLWHLQGTLSATRVATLVGHTNWVLALAFAPDGTQLVSGSWDNTVKLWEVESFHLRQTLTGHKEGLYAVAWSPDGRVVASAGFDKTIWLWDVERGSYRAALHGHTAIVYSMAITPDSKGLISGSEDGTVRVWDIESGQCTHVFVGRAVILHDVAWSPDSTWLASAGMDALVTIWDTTGKAQPKMLHGHSWHLFGVVWSPDGQMLASSGRDNAIRLWDATTGECRQVLRDPDRNDTMFYGVAWSPDGRLLASGSYTRGVQVWDMVTRTRCWIGLHPTRIRRVAWSPDGTRLAGSGDDGNVFLWAASDGKLLEKLQKHSGRVMSVAWSPDGRLLASGGGGKDGGELFVWDMENHRFGSYGKLVQTLKGHPGSVFAVAWSPTGEVVVSGGSDGAICWWEVKTGKCLRTCQGHVGWVWSLKVSPDGRMLASCGNDNTIRIWDLQSAEILQTLRHDRPYERLDITGIRGLNEAEIDSLQALGAIDQAEQ